MNTIRLRVCAESELGSTDVQPVELPRGTDRRPREALVLRGEDGQPRAYLNRCRHLPVPIDGGSRQYLTRGGEYLLCGTHGALYRKNDGMCVAGPCLNLALERIELVEEAGVLYLLFRVE
jgi:nitrite reductase/ring-hydroxylating ferredoxin subunit